MFGSTFCRIYSRFLVLYKILQVVWIFSMDFTRVKISIRL